MSGSLGISVMAFPFDILPSTSTFIWSISSSGFASAPLRLAFAISRHGRDADRKDRGSVPAKSQHQVDLWTFGTMRESNMLMRLMMSTLSDGFSLTVREKRSRCHPRPPSPQTHVRRNPP